MNESPLHVLYVEDNPADVLLIQDLMLEVPDHGLHIHHCESLGDVRNTPLQSPPDAILLDLNLPDTRGLDTYREIAALFPQQPIIILTVVDLEDTAIQAVRAGAQDYLIKGQLTGLLVCRSIRYAIERMTMTRSLYLANQHLEIRIAERTEALALANSNLMVEIEERKHQEQALQEQQHMLQSILDGLQAAVLFVDAESMRIFDINQLAEQLLKQPRHTIIGSFCHQTLCQDCPAQTGPCPALRNPSLHKDHLLQRHDGSAVPVLRTVLPTTIGGREHAIVILLDATERKAMERRLALAQKLEAVGRLAAGIAHEINTPIQYIGGNIDFFDTVQQSLTEIMELCGHLDAAFRAGEDPLPHLEALRNRKTALDLPHLLEEFRQALIDSHEGIQRITGIVQAMKKFSHPGSEQRTLVDVNGAIQNTVTISRNEWKYASDLQLDLDENLPHIRCVSGELNQVLLNIIVNAAQANAMKAPGSSEKQHILIRTRSQDSHVHISIADTGVGIPDNVRDKIFDPFFTLKDVGEGSGQGLAIVYSIVHRHGGSIDVASREGQGTTFTVILPIETSRQPLSEDRSHA